MFIITLKAKVPLRARYGLRKTICKVIGAQNKVMLTYQTPEKPATFDYQDITDDIATLMLRDAILLNITVDFAEAKYTGNIVNRSRDQLTRIGINGGEIPVNCAGGEVYYGFVNMLGSDVPHVTYLLGNMAVRARLALTNTQYPLNMYDLMQATGIIKGCAVADITCLAAREWIDGRMAAAISRERQELKAVKARAKTVNKRARAAEIKVAITKKVLGEESQDAVRTARLIIGEEV